MHIQPRAVGIENLHFNAPGLFCSLGHKEAPKWVRRNKDSLLRAAGQKRLLASATMGGSCTHPDQSRGLAHRRNLRAISRSESPPLFYPFFLLGGVALHECLVGICMLLRSSPEGSKYWASLRKEIADGWQHVPDQPLALHGCLTDRPHIEKSEAMPGNSRQLPSHRPFAPGEAPSVRDGPLLDEDRDIVPTCDLVRVAPGVFRDGSDAF